MKSIGGYFELELQEKKEYHKKAIDLNSGRNAFEYILKAKGYRKVYLPYYTCNVMLEPIIKLNLSYHFYSIDQNFRPLFNFRIIEEDAVFVYNNYFGLCDTIIKEISVKCNNLIVDNAHAFYSLPIPGIDTFYSPRKFFGVSDGAYLYCNKKLKESLEQDTSYTKFEHLLGRIDIGAQEFYSVFCANEDSLINQPIRRVSRLTKHLLSSIDYDRVKEIRRKNYKLLHKELQSTNKLNINLNEAAVPLVYPYLISNGKKLKRKLIENKIFVATYWPNVIDWADKGSQEYNLAENLLALPIDQRYGVEEMNIIIVEIGKLQ